MSDNSAPILKVQDFNVEFWVDGVWYPAAIDMNYEVHAGEVLAIVGIRTSCLAVSASVP